MIVAEVAKNKNDEFPSPTGVNHYESKIKSYIEHKIDMTQFPSPTGVNHYEYLVESEKEYENYK